MSRASEEVLLEDHLHRLKLPAMSRQYRECGRAARETGQSYEGYLLDLVTGEVEQRRARQLQRRLQEARFPVLKTLENTDLKKWPGLEALELREYAEGHYIVRRENILLIGKHGTGKTPRRPGLGVGSLAARPPGVVCHGGRPGQHAPRSPRGAPPEAYPGTALAVSTLDSRRGGLHPVLQRRSPVALSSLLESLREGVDAGDLEPPLCPVDHGLRRGGPDGRAAGSIDPSLHHP